MRQSRGRGSKVETKARPRKDRMRPSQLKKLPRAEADASRTTSLVLARTVCFLFESQSVRYHHSDWFHVLG